MKAGGEFAGSSRSGISGGEMELRVGNKYRLSRKIGSGSFGDIFLGERTFPSLPKAK